MTETSPLAQRDLGTDRPHGARVYDALLGGKTNYAADRKAAENIIATLPSARSCAHANRNFMHRAVRHLTQEAGIRQFLDIGTGIPTSPNLHEAAQEIAPDARIVYSDNDPIVLTHSRALHTSNPAGKTAYIEADATRPDSILNSPRLRDTLDLEQPVALFMLLLLHWYPRSSDPHRVTAELLDALPSGSYLAISHITNDFKAEAMQHVEDDMAEAGSGVIARSRSDIEAFFTGTELIDPGIVVPQQWRPVVSSLDAEPSRAPSTDVPIYAGVGYKR